MRTGTGLTLSFFFVASSGLANDNRTQLIENYKEVRSENPSLYQSAPISHIVPSFNMITYAVQFEDVGITLLPERDSWTSAGEKLELKGYNFQPYLALSLKSVSLGFSIVRSQLEADYTRSLGSSIYQYSLMDTSGLGLNLGLLPIPALRDKVKFAAILAVENLNAKHSIGMASSSPIDKSSLQTYRYTVNTYSLGLNLKWQVLSRLALISWADYRGVDLREGESVSKKGNATLTQTYLENDWDLFYLAYPKLRYGLDIGLKILGLDVRIGGVLGAVAGLNKLPDTIDDSSIQLSVSIDQKGN